MSKSQLKSKSQSKSKSNSSSNVEDEWMNFISPGYNNSDDDDDDLSSDLEDMNEIIKKSGEKLSSNLNFEFDSETPKANEIYISTKTKIAYLNQHIDLKEVFWKIPVLPYAKPSNGVIKKQMKFNSSTIEDYEIIQDLVKKEVYYEENVITNINNPTGRIKFKDIRKISIGISKKDIMSYRCKKKSAFYNCFVLIFRMKINQTFKEFHVKVFNTGKLEIPGIQNEATFQLLLLQVIDTLQPFIKEKLEYKENSEETVLINSNFNCGFFINREELYDILKMKYKTSTINVPISSCKYGFSTNLNIGY